MLIFHKYDFIVSPVPQIYTSFDLIRDLTLVIFLIGAIWAYSTKKFELKKYFVIFGCIFIFIGLITPVLHYAQFIQSYSQGQVFRYFMPTYAYLYDINLLYYLIFIVIAIIAIIYLLPKNRDQDIEIIRYLKYKPLLICGILSILVNINSYLELNKLLLKQQNAIIQFDVLGDTMGTPFIYPIYGGIISIFIGSIILILADLLKSRQIPES